MQGFVPGWTADAVWYQVMVSRFYNGSTENDPPGTQPWTDDWAKLTPGENPPLRQRLFERRYGGDLQGLRSKLPYLNSLGVNAIYLNPIFDASTEHKYDTTDQRHVDDAYGIAGSRLRLREETADPATWQWSDTDRLFLDFLADAHRQGFRVVLDGVFNHVGQEFWAWRDVKARGRASPYADWFDVTDWGPPLRWQAWDGPNGRLVNFRQVGDGLAPPVEAYLFAVVRRWMDPNGDGDPADGIDGWRLDAAEKVPHGFWQRFRQAVKAANPAAVILGEIWTEAGDWLRGNEFDIVTNYRFSGPVMRFFGQAGARYLPATWVDDLAVVRRDHPWEVTLGMFNLLGSHDTARAVTMLTDPQQHRDSKGEIPRPDLLEPDEDAFRRLKLAAFFQFTYPGAPLIYYGDEVGLYGGGDPFCRAPMWWPTSAPRSEAAGPPRYRADLLERYRELGQLRRTWPELRQGRFRILLADDARRLVAFTRRGDDRETVVIVNGSLVEARVELAVGRTGQDGELWVWGTARDEGLRRSDGEFRTQSDGRCAVSCPALAGVLIRFPAAP
jgi:cyclomaltodextrinase / maltogenic alpha-amylase / neopullulanase